MHLFYNLSHVKTVCIVIYSQFKQTIISWVILSKLLLNKLTAPLRHCAWWPHLGQGNGILLQYLMKRFSVSSDIIFRKIVTSTGERLWRNVSIFYLTRNYGIGWFLPSPRGSWEPRPCEWAWRIPSDNRATSLPPADRLKWVSHASIDPDAVGCCRAAGWVWKTDLR